MMYNVNSLMFIEIYCYDCFSAPALERIMRQCLQGVGPADQGPPILENLENKHFYMHAEASGNVPAYVCYSWN
jgi:hypothetical protein